MRVIGHQSQSPANVETERADCIRRRNIAAKFHYETDRQARLWLNVHNRLAPSKEMIRPYAEAAEALASGWTYPDGALIALGCGGGEKEIGILKALPKGTRFVPTDVSTPLALKTAQAALKINPSWVVNPLVFDLLLADNLLEFIDEHVGQERVFTFFGIIPNFSPTLILPRLQILLRSEDRLLLSANLAPNGMDPILPQYDNDITREWLAEFPMEHGAGQGAVKFTVETSGYLQRIVAHYQFSEPCVMEANGEFFEFNSGNSLQLFVSYRYTVESLTDTLKQHGIIIENAFLTSNGEEGVFICGPQ
jgi:hypothetical protein